MQPAIMVSKPGVVAVIGGGKMGCDIAAVLAAGGWEVHCQEPDARMRRSLPVRHRRSLEPLGTPKAAAARLHVHAQLAQIPWRSVRFVVEAAPEQLPLKQALFAQIEALAPRQAILSTNTSSLRLADVMRKVKHRDRTALVHWSTPANIAPLIEVVKGTQTSPRTIAQVNAWLRALGKLPVNLNRDVPGMIVNRAQHAMLRECFDLVEKGIASIEDIDLAVRYGFGYRYVVCGPVRQRDLNGLVINLRAAAQIYPTLSNRRIPPRIQASRVRAGHVGVTVRRGFYRWDTRALGPWLERYEKTLAELLARMRSIDGHGARQRRSAAKARRSKS
jgi:3-hydroxybutyryl-CoA dehydrogenase